MAAKNKRRRINPVVRILSQIYEIDYKITMRIYNRFNRNLAVAKIELNRMYQNQNELAIIDDVNLYF